MHIPYAHEQFFICFYNFTDYDSPTLTPKWGNIVYGIDGSSSYDLSWHFKPRGRTIKEVDLKYVCAGKNDVTVARRQPGQQLQVNPSSGYFNRIAFAGSLRSFGSVGSITFRILNVTQNDSRIFKCDLSFNLFDPPNLQSWVKLVVAGKYLIFSNGYIIIGDPKAFQTFDFAS